MNVLYLIFHFAANGYGITPQSIGLPNSTGTIGQGAANIVRILMSVMGGLAMIFIVVGGIQMSVSAGDSKRVGQARDTILYAVVGLVIAIAAYAITSFVSGAVNGGH